MIFVAYTLFYKKNDWGQTSYGILFHNTFSKIVIKVVDYFSIS